MTAENPNSRGWRYRRWFIDLDAVVTVAPGAAVTASSDEIGTIVVLRDSELDLYMPLTNDEHNSLLDALEVYRSGR